MTNQYAHLEQYVFLYDYLTLAPNTLRFFMRCTAYSTLDIGLANMLLNTRLGIICKACRYAAVPQ